MENTETYSNVHRLMAHACLNRGTMLMEDGLNIFQDIYKRLEKNVEDATKENLLQAIELINEKMRSISQKIDVARCHITEQDFLVFVNTLTSSIMKIQSVHNETEQAYFRLLLKEIIYDDDYSISQIAAVNICDDSVLEKKLKRDRAEDLLEKWLSDGYFVLYENQLHFGVRTICEFKTYFKTNFSDNCLTCGLCKEILFKGFTCGESNCTAIMHKNCLSKYFKTVPKCPKCKKLWSGPTIN